MKALSIFPLALAISLAISACKGGNPVPRPSDRPPTHVPTQAASQTPAPTARVITTATAAPTSTETTPFSARLDLPSGVDPDSYAAGLREGLESDAQVLAGLPHYDLAFHVDIDGRTLHGLEQVRFSNTTGEELEQIIFRLYPNYPKLSGQPGRTMEVLAVSVDGEPVDVLYQSERTAVAVPLTSALADGEAVSIELRFALELPPATGRSNLDLNSAYPLLATFENGEGWRTEIGCPPDFVVSDFASYGVNLTAPSSYVVAATGTEMAVTEHGDGTSTHWIVAGPVRDFAISMSPDYQNLSAVLDGVVIRVLARPDDEIAAEQVLGFATEAFGVYNTLYGPYPYNEVEIVVHPDGGGGTEMPGLFYVWYGKIPGDPYGERPTAHEMAHQWWYGVVGNDAQREPWLDEAFARYSEIIYLEEVHGQEAADDAIAEEAEIVQRGPNTEGGSYKIGGSVCSFPDLSDYVRTVYSKGMLFMHELRKEVGSQVFFAVLHEYFRTYRYKVASGSEFLEVANRISGTNLNPLYEEWVRP